LRGGCGVPCCAAKAGRYIEAGIGAYAGCDTKSDGATKSASAYAGGDAGVGIERKRSRRALGPGQ
jgi:hypothetical protein